MQLVCALVALMAVWDLSTILPTKHVDYAKLSKALPFKTTVFSPSTQKIALSSILPEAKMEDGEARQKNGILTPAHKPDIFIFVIESLREDFITDAVAPRLAQFKKENVSFDLALSSANCTQLSWFSLFYSKFPFHWAKEGKAERKTGSPVLKIFKEMGYAIHVYTSAMLGFYEMDQRLFGEKCELVDRFFLFGHGGQIPPHESDGRTVDKLTEEMRSASKKGGHLHIVFLESTHFDYSWPKEKELVFAPIVDQIDYLKVACAKQDLEPIKNRYRNAIHYVDGLFGKFLDALKETKGMDEAVVVVTADHGEEFFEDGHLFHASNLNFAQTHVPLYYKFGSSIQLPGTTLCKATSHIDIMPTLLHYLFKKDLFQNEMQGESIFKAKRSPFLVSARYNGVRNPVEFFIHNGRKLLTVRLEAAKEFSKSHLSVLSVKDLYDQNISNNFSLVRDEFEGAFEALFQRDWPQLGQSLSQVK